MKSFAHNSTDPRLAMPTKGAGITMKENGATCGHMPPAGRSDFFERKKIVRHTRGTRDRHQSASNCSSLNPGVSRASQ